MINVKNLKEINAKVIEYQIDKTLPMMEIIAEIKRLEAIQ